MSKRSKNFAPDVSPALDTNPLITQLTNEPQETVKEAEPVSTLPIMKALGFVRVTTGKVGGFTTVVYTIQGDKVLETEILDRIWPRNSAEDDFKVKVAYDLFQKAPENLHYIDWQDGKLIWKA